MNRGAGVAFANLDGSGGGALPTPGAKFEEAAGLAIDPAGRRVYWANEVPGTPSIFVANLDGSGAEQLNTAGATLKRPNSVVVDPADRRLYWLNEEGAKRISFANLDGSGEGGSIEIAGASSEETEGLAIDSARQEAYWTGRRSNTIAFAKLDGSGAGTLNTTGATVASPRGIAIDPFAGRVYWGDLGTPSIGFANLDNSGGGGDFKAESTDDGGKFPILRVAPHVATPPVIGGSLTTGSPLSCSQGTWGRDLIESFYYQAPQSFSYQWSRDGADIPGATQSSLAPDRPGDYRCRVTAMNQSGATSATSDPRRIVARPTPARDAGARFGKNAGITLTLAARRVVPKGPVAVTVANGNSFAVSGRLSARSSKSGAAHGPQVKLTARAFQVAAGAKTVVKLALPKPLRRLLADKHRLSLALSAVVKDSVGDTRTVPGSVAVKLATKKRPPPG